MLISEKAILGHAILNYERALALDPNQAEARANLQLVRDQARALALAPSWMEAHLDFLTRDQYAWLGGGCFLGCGRDYLRPLFRPASRSGLDFCPDIVRRDFAPAQTFAVYQLETGSSGSDLAIVTKKNIQARLATAESAGTVLLLPAGKRNQSPEHARRLVLRGFA